MTMNKQEDDLNTFARTLVNSLTSIYARSLGADTLADSLEAAAKTDSPPNESGDDQKGGADGIQD